MLDHFRSLGLIEEYVYDDDGTKVQQIAGWRDHRPVDLTSAERKRRFRQRLYGDAYRGTEGDVMEVDLGDEARDTQECASILAAGNAARDSEEPGS